MISFVFSFLYHCVFSLIFILLVSQLFILGELEFVIQIRHIIRENLIVSKRMLNHHAISIVGYGNKLTINTRYFNQPESCNEQQWRGRNNTENTN